ncbi:MAG: TonB-dependent receptor, partial [Candidatus Acidiferrales bacterium]
RNTLLILVAFLACMIGTQAQQARGPQTTVSGIVTAATHEPIPGATVRIENTTTHLSWVTWSDEDGKFGFPGLPAGAYHLTSEALGFQSSSLDITLEETSPPPPPLTITLQVQTLAEMSAGTAATSPSGKPGGTGNQAPAATANHALGAQSNPTGGQTPSAGSRRAPPGAAIPAGVSNAIRQGMGGFQQVDVDVEGGGTPAAGEAQGTAPSESSAGGAMGAAASSDSYLLNGSVGVSAATFSPGFGGAGGLPGSNLGVELGPAPGQRGGMFAGGGRGGAGGPGGFRGGGGGGRMFMSQRLRQQVNRIHWGFVNTYENSAFDARPYSLTEPNPPKISHYNERFGLNAGGPLVIPHIYDGSDKTFFFANYTLGRQKEPIDSFATVPTIAERGGNFCAVVAELYNPFSNLNGPRQPLGCSIPITMQNNAALGLLNYIPMPNVSTATAALNYHLEATVPQSSDSVNIHILHTISKKFSLNGGYNFNSTRGNTLSSFLTLGGTSSTRNQNADLHFVQTWSPRLTNDSYLNFSRSRTQVLSDNSYVNNIAAQLNISGVSTSPIDYGIPQINFSSFTGLSDPVPSLVRNQTIRFNDTVTYVLTKHAITMGGEIRRMELNTASDPIPRGAFSFTGQMTSQLDSSGNLVPGELGVDFADFLLGVPQTTQAQFGSTSTYFRNWGFIGFAQDDWRINPRFTFEYGLRYQAETPPIELYNTLANIAVNSDFTAAQVVVPGQPNPFGGPLPRSLINGDYNNWAPRIGLAWKPFQKQPIVVRAGYSIFYNESVYDQLARELANQPPWAQAQFNVNNVPTQILTLEQGFLAQSQSSSTTITNTKAVDPNYKPGNAQIWDLSAERQFPHGWFLDVTYTGTKGTHLDLLEAPNRILAATGQRQIPNADGFTYDQSVADSSYNALQVRLQKHFSRGLSFYSLYTYGKSLDDASAIGGGGGVVVQNQNDFRQDWGRSAFDMTHQFRSGETYQLPFGPRQRWARSGWAGKLLGNYRINGVVTINSGLPFTALAPPSSNIQSGGGFSERADQNGNACLPAGQRTPLDFFNTSVFSAPAPGTLGTAARGTICGPGTFNINAGFSRSFVFGRDQQHHMDLRWEVNNLTNTPNFAGLSTVLGSSTFGEALGAGSMRSMDVVLRVMF